MPHGLEKGTLLLYPFIGYYRSFDTQLQYYFKASHLKPSCFEFGKTKVAQIDPFTAIHERIHLKSVEFLCKIILFTSSCKYSENTFCLIAIVSNHPLTSLQNFNISI